MPSVLEQGRRVVELRARGIGRWITALFLGAWLVGWALGEGFAISILLSALSPSLGSRIHGLPRVPAGPAGLAMAGFVLLWLALWTLGGASAMFAVLTSLWGCDRIEFDASGIRRISSIGPFRRERSFSRQDIHRVALRPRGLVLVTSRGSLTLSWMGSPAERAELRDEIERTLDLGAAAPSTHELPAGWESAIDTEGQPVLLKSPGPRRRQAGFVTALFVALAIVAALLVGGASTGNETPRAVPTAVMTFLAIACGAGAAWLWLGGEAIRVRSGQADVVRWFGSRRWLRHFDNPTIGLEHSVDSDGDDWYRLVLRGSAGATTLASALRDPDQLEQVGGWIAARLGSELARREPPTLATRIRLGRSPRAS